ncbi:hypothetical protein BN159_0101 [Streptomyces davaonensis JCM 4913]|uniref:Uncharacterized protein n=1 Tax=Streptomyces davaonensis (strain DSM 101723 / JCM 4913 / KCC S-0913 / 768) TaxID=1214101 RepID=K4QUN8_STRDJ|nr:hypothetical protein [Streptomyces davaonensis]CCK24480.1 hypothetical protein BN159_0101 [Streptomyces davaonensis JCM 4913]
MASLSFTPTFRHTDYVDNRDRVQAGGPNGFNARFRALEEDLGKLSEVVTQVDGALQQRPTAGTLIDTTVTIPAFNSAASTGGVFDVQLGDLLPLTSHAFHFVSVRPGANFLNAQVTWEEIAFAADTGGGTPMIARMLRLRHQRPIAVTVSVRVMRLELQD